MNSNNPIGIFDSGLGGLTVTAQIHELLPEENLLFFGDSARNPYGTKSPEQIQEYALEIVRQFEQQQVKAVVIACNTATSAAAPLLRKTFDFDVIGMEPALKVAASLKPHSRIAVWATALTLEEEKFKSLMSRFDSDHEILSVPCPKLVRCVEEDRLNDLEYVQSILREYLDQSQLDSLDAIVLGCTHFVFYKEALRQMIPSHVTIVDGNEGTVRHLKELLEKKNLLASGQGSVHLANSDPQKLELSNRLYKQLEESHE